MCSEWIVGYYNVSDGSVADVSDAGISWVLQEFFVSNWWEGYVWNGQRATGRNTNFVPSNTSTYPFLCSVPPAALEANLDQIVDSYYDDGYLPSIVRPTNLLQWIDFYLTPSEFDDYYRLFLYKTKDTTSLAARQRALRGIGGPVGAAETSQEEHSAGSGDIVPEQLQIERLLANRDPMSGRMLMDIDDVPDHIGSLGKDDVDGMRDHMFHGRDPLRPWLLEDGGLIL